MHNKSRIGLGADEKFDDRFWPALRSARLKLGPKRLDLTCDGLIWGLREQMLGPRGPKCDDKGLNCDPHRAP